MAPNSVARSKNTLNVALNWYIKETGIDWTSPFAGLLVKGAGSSEADRHSLTDEQVEKLKTTFEDDPITNALFVILRDTGARLAEVAGLRNTGCPEAISMAILGNGSNTVASNYRSGYALEIMREHMDRVWN